LKFDSKNQTNVNDYFSVLFFLFSLHRTIWKSHVTISLHGCATHAWSRSPWWWRMWEL